MKRRFLALIVIAGFIGCRQAAADALALMPGMAGPLRLSAEPASFDAAGFGKIYVTGTVSGLGLLQDHAAKDNSRGLLDWGNAQLFIQKPDGIFQFFVQGGVYSFPALGAAYMRAEDAAERTFGYIPQAFAKIAPTDSFSIMAGKLPTLLGAEYTFTFENMNIERGLLWNQTNAVTRGVQGNYSAGPFAVSLSWNDGYYSDRFNWVTASATWTIDAHNTLSATGGGNLGHTARADFITPLAQNNGRLYGLLYTWTSGRWLLSPELQYNRVEKDAALGIGGDAAALGVGVLGRYSFNDDWSLGGRLEYIGSAGDKAGPNLLYGTGSNAWSATITPTCQHGNWFGRAEASFVHAGNITPGDAFGAAGTAQSQSRIIFEAGAAF